jgi:hypothetical protein
MGNPGKGDVDRLIFLRSRTATAFIIFDFVTASFAGCARRRDHAAQNADKKGARR